MKELGVLAMPAPVTEWAIFHEPGDEMRFKGGYWPQVMLVRDRISSLVSETYEERREKVSVVSSHTSKSIKLPVFYFEAAGVRFWLRYNFHNWNVSVEVGDDLHDPGFGDWVSAFDGSHGYCYCEGMQDQRWGPFAKSRFKFTLCIGDDYELFTFFWLFRRERGITRKDS